MNDTDLTIEFKDVQLTHDVISGSAILRLRISLELLLVRFLPNTDNIVLTLKPS